MSRPRETFQSSSRGLLRSWLTPSVRHCAVAIALMLPGSFVVLPLIWIWRRGRIGSSAHPGTRQVNEGISS